jgi:hypothetical protein
MFLGFGSWSALIHLAAKRPSVVLVLGVAILAGNYLCAAERRYVPHEPARPEVQTAALGRTASLPVDSNRIIDQQLRRVISSCASNRSATTSPQKREMYPDPGNLMVDNLNIDLSAGTCRGY